jgi:hypothetical protein
MTNRTPPAPGTQVGVRPGAGVDREAPVVGAPATSSRAVQCSAVQSRAEQRRAAWAVHGADGRSACWQPMDPHPERSQTREGIAYAVRARITSRDL